LHRAAGHLRSSTKRWPPRVEESGRTELRLMEGHRRGVRDTHRATDVENGDQRQHFDNPMRGSRSREPRRSGGDTTTSKQEAPTAREAELGAAAQTAGPVDPPHLGGRESGRERRRRGGTEHHPWRPAKDHGGRAPDARRHRAQRDGKNLEDPPGSLFVRRSLERSRRTTDKGQRVRTRSAVRNRGNTARRHGRQQCRQWPSR
jgi:hypothetical protein